MLSLLTYQTYEIFINYKNEYPWKQVTLVNTEKIEDYFYRKNKVRMSDRVYHSLITPEYSIEHKLPLFGFAHKRYWNEINDFINNENTNNNETLVYMSNELKTISEWYIDAQHGVDNEYYLIGVKRPFSFVNDYKFPQVGGKSTVWEIENDDGETVVRIYRVKGK